MRLLLNPKNSEMINSTSLTQWHLTKTKANLSEQRSKYDPYLCQWNKPLYIFGNQLKANLCPSLIKAAPNGQSLKILAPISMQTLSLNYAEVYGVTRHKGLNLLI